MASLSGQKCPPLGGLDFIQGQPFDILNPQGPVLVEFWATYCKICPKAWPHLARLQQQYGPQGLRVVGVCAEPESPTVRQCVQQHGKGMSYALATDNRGEAYRALMESSGRNDVPHAFLIDSTGVIRYHENPMRLQFALEVEAMMRELAQGGTMSTHAEVGLERGPSCGRDGVCTY